MQTFEEALRALLSREESALLKGAETLGGIWHEHGLDLLLGFFPFSRSDAGERLVEGYVTRLTDVNVAIDAVLSRQSKVRYLAGAVWLARDASPAAIATFAEEIEQLDPVVASSVLLHSGEPLLEWMTTRLERPTSNQMRRLFDYVLSRRRNQPAESRWKTWWEFKQRLDFMVFDRRYHMLIDLVGRSEDPAVAPVLLDLLDSPDRQIRAATIEALGRAGNTIAIPGLCKLMREDDRWMRSRVAMALRRIGDPAAISELGQALYDESSYVRLYAAEGLGELELSQAVPLLMAVLHDETSWYVQRAAVQALARIDEPVALPALINLMERPPKTRGMLLVQEAAARLLRSWEIPEGLAAVNIWESQHARQG